MTYRRHIVIVDDEANIGSSLRLILEGEGYRVTICGSVARFQEHRAMGRADVYLLDLRLPDGTGVELLRSLRQSDDQTPAIMISGHGTIRDAVDATRIGAFDFLEKPLARERVLLAVKNALERSDLQQENQTFRELIGDRPRMVGSSAAFQHVLDEALKVARSDVSVLLTGESGTGKELLAECIHRASPFASRPFIKVNCAAIPAELIESELFGHEKGAFTGAVSARRGKFELADGGSILLDEVGDLHGASQAKLLRVLQDGEVQRLGSERTMRVVVRVIAATNRALDQLIGEGKFREDLYYRLGVVPIRVPALRERLDDVRGLAEYFLGEFCARNNFRPKHIDADVFSVFERHAWPGNVRELRNVVERMAILTSESRLTVESIPFEIRTQHTSRFSGLDETRDAAERDRIRRALDETKGNVSSAARLLGIERTHLHKRIRSLGIK
jgi:two-component system nitrogen regulation response regulator NtrX